MSRVLVIDFETANTSATSACAIGAILLENNQIVQKYSTFIKPPTSAFQFTYIHGITWDKVKDAPTFKEIWAKEFEALYQSVDLIVAHNIGFDSRVLQATAEHHGIKLPPKATDCTVKISRAQLKFKPAKLDHVCRELQIPLQHHEALSDSLASAYIYIYAKTGEKPWLTNKPRTREDREKEWADAVSSMNSPKAKEILTSLLKK